MQLFKILGAFVFLLVSLALSILAGSIAARITRHVPAWCALTLAGCMLFNAAYLLATIPIFQWLNAENGAPLDWQRMQHDALHYAGLGALLGLLGFLVALRNAPRFFKRKPL